MASRAKNSPAASSNATIRLGVVNGGQGQGRRHAAPETTAPDHRVAGAAPVQFRLTALDQAIYPQQQNCAENGDDNAAEVDAGHGAEAYGRGDEAADNGAGNADDNGDDDAAGVAARHQQLGQRTGDQPQYDPGNNTHCFFSPWLANNSGYSLIVKLLQSVHDAR